MSDISIILPTWNERECIEHTLISIASQLKKDDLSYEILVIDDDSQDGTQKIVQRLSKLNPNIRLIKHLPPRSFGYSIRDGLQLAKGKLSIILMADFSDDPKFIKEMWKRYNEGCSVVVGSRFLKDSIVYDYPFFKLFSNRLFNLAVMFAFFTKISDTSNNFKAFDTAKIKEIKVDCKGFEVGAELMLRMLLKKERICEIPVTWTNRTKGTAKFKLYNTFINYFSLFIKMFKLAYFG